MPTIDEYIAGLPPQLSAAAAGIRALCDRHLEGASSAVMWGGPTWFVTGDPVCYLRSEGGEILFGFWNGGSLHDPSGRMRQTPPQRSSDARVPSTASTCESSSPCVM